MDGIICPYFHLNGQKTLSLDTLLPVRLCTESYYIERDCAGRTGLQWGGRLSGAPTRSNARPARNASGRRVQRPTRRRNGRRWLVRLTVAGGAVAAGLLGWAALERHSAPTANTELERFDAIIVLGSPADADGNPTPTQLARVTEGVHEYERGAAPRLLMTGGAAKNRFVEAQVMAHTAEAQGVPQAAIFVESHALDTIQNACYAVRLMQAHGWTSAEVVSSASHLPRAGLILSRLPIEWRTHAAPLLEPQSEAGEDGAAVLETLKTARYLVWARWRERCR